MGTTLTAQFETRREAEMTVERLAQEYDVDRADIFIAAVGKENTVGEELAGSDRRGGDPGGEDRHDAALNGSIEVSVDIEDEGLANRIRDAFAEFGAHDVAQS
ncbi:hypothetical protein [Aureimonas leprariae]|uniref:Uncharacterized protein n=1 Tax=Plantimonas leprariae TaxID=2615207 RepID=A0A7V7TXT8_9HYPH|nr:hypothetical protein [Aureimonas leprariae]KAB0682074.1 hypothetical protein F6X38_04550 [Aureimonas leprariae]